MKRSELLKKCWISFEKRLPPNKEIYILVWNPKHNNFICGFSHVFRWEYLQMKKDPHYLEKWEATRPSKMDELNIGAYRCSHWMLITGPNI